LRRGSRDLRVSSHDVPLQGDGASISLLVSVGSTNFDNRSFRLNDEANLNVTMRRSAARSRRLSCGSPQSRRVTLRRVERPSLTDRLMESDDLAERRAALKRYRFALARVSPQRFQEARANSTPRTPHARITG
jgi:phosphatidylserine/phosphatidylglycerophosphate/cardiolipin synthase-like enzyme